MLKLNSAAEIHFCPPLHIDNSKRAVTIGQLIQSSTVCNPAFTIRNCILKQFD